MRCVTCGHSQTKGINKTHCWSKNQCKVCHYKIGNDLWTEYFKKVNKI
jgi:hypothetical protein